jgi:hypothetical protein
VIDEHILTDWFCWQCGAVTPGGQPDPYPCCTRPLVFRWSAVQKVDEMPEEATRA